MGGSDFFLGGRPRFFFGAGAGSGSGGGSGFGTATFGTGCAALVVVVSRVVVVSSCSGSVVVVLSGNSGEELLAGEGVDGDSLTGRLGRLILDKFFDAHTSAYKAWAELGSRGWKHDRRTVERAIAELASKGFLRREGEGYILVPSMRRNVVEE